MSELTFGKWLKHERETMGLTQAELARQLACATITLRKIESDERRPAREIVERLANIFELKLEQRSTFFKFARNGTLPTFFSDEPNARQFRARVSNLPLTASPFFGRGIELETICKLLQNKNVRVLTLTGTGGIGKTRLATEAGDVLRDTFRDGIFFVDLAPITHAALVPAAIAQVLNLGQVEMQRGNVERAAELFCEGIKLNRAAERGWRVIEFLAAFAELASAQNKWERAAVLTGAVEAWLEQQALHLTPADRSTFDQYAAKTRAQLGAAHFSNAWERGQAMSLHQATAYALEADTP